MVALVDVRRLIPRTDRCWLTRGWPPRSSGWAGPLVLAAVRAPRTGPGPAGWPGAVADAAVAALPARAAS